MNNIKSGTVTSEFWVTMVTQVVSFAVLGGWVHPSDVGDITNAAISIITALMSLLTALAYIRGRIELKKHSMTIPPQTVNLNQINTNPVNPQL